MSSARKSTRSGPRVHRLPKHLNLDYILIPAPHDLSIESATEKSPLPAIIVTPSSPSSTKDFSIAFLAPPKKPTLRERVSEYFFPKPPTSPPTAGFSPPLISTSSQCSWREKWRTWTSASRQAPIALPITSPVSGNAPASWHYDPPSKRRLPCRFIIFASIVFLLVFCHVFTHYIASSAGSMKAMSGADGSGVVDAGVGSAVKQGWFDWQGWFGLGDYGRISLRRSGVAFASSDASIEGLASATGFPAALRSAAARNEV
ncbi:hypothetical protein CC2G_010968 [Coprinopsis cinerea AmutBmut pab1-1]|nr:hypothetical protein CC2G_010968 [Coprinopsis cinerea AmutBmut pab1-1]